MTVIFLLHGEMTKLLLIKKVKTNCSSQCFNVVKECSFKISGDKTKPTQT